MDIAQILANSLPFLMAYAIQGLEAGMPSLVTNTLRVFLPEDVQIQGFPRQTAIKLAVHVYHQFSFIFSVLLSTVSALGLTLVSKKREVGILVGFVLIVGTGMWIARWQPLARGLDETEGAKCDKEMRCAARCTITLMLFATLYARY